MSDWDGEEHRGIESRIFKIERDLSNLVVLLEQDMKSRNEFRDRMEKIVGGNSIAIYGNNEVLGLNSRVKTLEDAHINHRNNLRVIYIAIVGVIVNAIWKVLPFVK